MCQYFGSGTSVSVIPGLWLVEQLVTSIFVVESLSSALQTGYGRILDWIFFLFLVPFIALAGAAS